MLECVAHLLMLPGTFTQYLPWYLESGVDYLVMQASEALPCKVSSVTFDVACSWIRT
jgi:hypothetical protein